MTRILLISRETGSRRWEHELLRRLLAHGHTVFIRHAPLTGAGDRWIDLVLALEARRFGPSLLSPAPPLGAREASPAVADVVIDLSGSGSAEALQLQFDGSTDLGRGVAAMLANGAQPELRIIRNGSVVGQARPMIGDRVWLSRFGDDVLSGAIALVEQALARFEAGILQPLAAEPALVSSSPAFLRHYLPFFIRGFGARVAQKLLWRRRPFYWQVAYRVTDGPGVADTGALDGPPFSVLPDDGTRFYADPFPYEHQGRHFLFVEEYPYRSGKGVIAVTELGDDRSFGQPRTVLEEPHHLSYPQVFAYDDQIYMVPESSAARELVLYRAVQFPDQWVRDTVLIDHRNINDATLLQTAGQFWLFGTERFDHGSASDKLVVFAASQLRGPWHSHALNPIAIDHSAARPGGAFVRQGSQLLLPVQDGSSSYGDGLGLMTLERLDDHGVVFSRPSAIRPGAAWNRAGIHTLNRAGSLEVVDSAG